MLNPIELIWFIISHLKDLVSSIISKSDYNCSVSCNHLLIAFIISFFNVYNFKAGVGEKLVRRIS